MLFLFLRKVTVILRYASAIASATASATLSPILPHAMLSPHPLLLWTALFCIVVRAKTRIGRKAALFLATRSACPYSLFYPYGKDRARGSPKGREQAEKKERGGRAEERVITVLRRAEYLFFLYLIPF